MEQSKQREDGTVARCCTGCGQLKAVRCNIGQQHEAAVIQQYNKYSGTPTHIHSAVEHLGSSFCLVYILGSAREPAHLPASASAASGATDRSSRRTASSSFSLLFFTPTANNSATPINNSSHTTHSPCPTLLFLSASTGEWSLAFGILRLLPFLNACMIHDDDDIHLLTSGFNLQIRCAYNRATL